jgi:peroxiredoxin
MRDYSLYKMNIVKPIMIFLSMIYLQACVTLPKSYETQINDLKFENPPKEIDRSYLNIPANKTKFSLSDLQSEIVIIEILDMYCQFCQEEAENINRLFDNIQNDGFGKKIQMIGVGRNNSKYETEVFAEKFNVEFPLIPDKSMIISDTLGCTRTPYFFCLEKQPTGQYHIFLKNPGPIEHIDQFYFKVIKQLNKEKSREI